MTPTETRPPVGREDRLLAWPQVREIVGLSRTTAWRLQKAGLFPDPIQVSVNRVAWRERDVETWCAERAPRSSRSPFLRLPPQPRRTPREPRPPPETRPETRPETLPSKTRQAPSPPPPPFPGPLFQELSPAPQPSAKRRPNRRRRPAIAEGQIAFDF